MTPKIIRTLVPVGSEQELTMAETALNETGQLRCAAVPLGPQPPAVDVAAAQLGRTWLAVLAVNGAAAAQEARGILVGDLITFRTGHITHLPAQTIVDPGPPSKWHECAQRAPDHRFSE